MKKRIDVSWGGGTSDLFLDLTGKQPRVLDFEYDGEELHERCGGKTYYVSCSGCSGAGWLEDLGSLLPLGAYRVDTTYNDCQWFTSLGKSPYGHGSDEVLVAIPYASHSGDESLLRQHPTVVKIRDKVIYCDFETNFTEILRIIFAGEELPEACVINGRTYERRGHRTLRRTFSGRADERVAYNEEISMEFYNLCSMDTTPDPWEFFQGKLGDFRAQWSKERMFQLLAVEKLQDGTFVRTMKIAGERYRGVILDGNPLETGKLTAGWERLAHDVLVRFYNKSNEVHLVAYVSAKEAHEKLARRLAYRMGEGEEFISFVSACDGEYAEFELVVSKVSYLLNQADQLKELRKGLARKIREDVTDCARQWVDNVNDQAILEVIPDDMVVKFDDSLNAGNCRPGTESFVSKFFPGQTQTIAGELKKFADNYNVMRIFRYLATIGHFDYKVKTVG